MELLTLFLLFLFVVVLIISGIYYVLRKIDLKHKNKYPDRFNGKFFAIHVPGDGEYFCKRYWFWQVEKRKFLESVFKEEQKARNLQGGIYFRRSVKRGKKNLGEKGSIIFLREVFMKVN